MVVDDNVDTLTNLKKLLYFEKDIEIVATASSGEEAINTAAQHQPDVILMDINMPGMDGIVASESISARVPGVQIVMMSVQGEADYLRRSMLAGAREFLIKPFSSDELAATLRRVYTLGESQRNLAKGAAAPSAPSAPAPTSAPSLAKGTAAPAPATTITRAPAAPAPPTAAAEPGRNGKALVIFSANGGVGRSTLAVNLAIAFKEELKAKVALVDCSLRFGDVGVLLNLTAERTLSDICSAEGGVDSEVLVEMMASHPSGVKVLLAPASPELADLVTSKDLRLILTTLKAHFDYIVVDTFTSLDELMLNVLDLADQILLLTTSEIPSIKNTKLFFEVTDALNYPSDKTLLVLNKSDPKSGITPQDIQASIKHPVFALIEKDERAFTQAVQTGQPFVVNQKNAPASVAVNRLVKLLTRPAGEPVEAQKPPARRAGIFR